MVCEVLGGSVGGATTGGATTGGASGAKTGGVELFGFEKLLLPVDPVGGGLVPNAGFVKLPPLGGVELPGVVFPGVDGLPPVG